MPKKLVLTGHRHRTGKLQGVAFHGFANARAVQKRGLSGNWPDAPLGRKAWLLCGSDRGGERAAVIYTLIGTAKRNDVDPQAWLADVLARIGDHPASRLDDLQPQNWRKDTSVLSEAA